MKPSQNWQSRSQRRTIGRLVQCPRHLSRLGSYVHRRLGNCSRWRADVDASTFFFDEFQTTPSPKVQLAFVPRLPRNPQEWPPL